MGRLTPQGHIICHVCCEAVFRMACGKDISVCEWPVAFIVSGKVCPRAWCDHCLTHVHASFDCPLSHSRGSAKKPLVMSQRSLQATSSKEICRNFNHGRCSRGDCPRRHVCLTQGCLRPHPATSCPSKRSSPRNE